MTRALGGFEELVLLALLRLGDGAFGVNVRREIESRTGRETSTGALYTTLERLENRDLISSELGDATPARGGRRRKRYALTEGGMEALRESFDAYASMVKGLEARLASADGEGA
jgi:DNA-binding PadR family transcriptional regulator